MIYYLASNATKQFSYNSLARIVEIKHPDRLAKSNDEKVELKVFDTENSVDNKPVAKKMMYAEVIDIEDPDREQL